MANLMPNMPYRPSVQFRDQLPDLVTIYQPLDPNDFRLLLIQGYDQYGLLRCSLQHVPFKEDVRSAYTAASYTWDETDKLWYGEYDTCEKPIRLNGVAVLVRDKVANILCLALQHGRTLVWVDAICINQDDLEEKKHQLARMGTIYDGASEVISFLGSPSRETDAVCDYVNEHYMTPPRNWPSWFFVGYLNIFGKDYWKRAWVFQEVALAARLLLCCGSRIIAFETLHAMGAQVDSDMDTGGIKAMLITLKVMRVIRPAISRIRKEGTLGVTDPEHYVTKGMHATFLEVMKVSRGHNGCSNARDLLYSRVALASDAHLLIPYPDYDMPVEELYKRFATNHIIRTGTLEIFTYATSTKRSLPTWVPDWTSLHPGWYNKAGALSTSLSGIQWAEMGLPRVSQCRSEVTVQGRVLKRFRKVDFDYLMHSAILNAMKYPAEYPISEIPRYGDLLCVLRGCAVLLYLRPVEKHFIIVGRANASQTRLFQPQIGLITSEDSSDGKKTKLYALANIEKVRSLQEQIFPIR